MTKVASYDVTYVIFITRGRIKVCKKNHKPCDKDYFGHICESMIKMNLSVIIYG